MLTVLRQLQNHSGLKNVKYDYVLVGRHDLNWKTPVDLWPANFSKFNFASRCEAGLPETGCVNDIFFTMPGNFIDTFSSLLGKECYSIKDPSGHHGCFSGMVKEVGAANVGFSLDYRPNYTNRECNDFVEISSCHPICRFYNWEGCVDEEAYFARVESNRK